ncbi:MAG: hypothetical protein O3B41_11045 [Bacteroidetes bacterium]|nr:hypothetical protein [Bacteroidota bacterium]
MEFKHNAPSNLRLGIVLARGVLPEASLPELDLRIAQRLLGLGQGLSPEEEQFRASVRDVFRNGSYKPTGRGKPASEYLLRTALEGNFPRINSVVDCCNLISIENLLPISMWDVSAAHSENFEFRLGMESESFVFNSSGQTIELKDLIVGCAIDQKGSSRPIVNAIKDSMGTKTGPSTFTVAAALYAPIEEGPFGSLEGACQSFVHLLGQTAATTKVVYTLLNPGQQAQL